nr:unnamed protein product [Callosobruchus analis]
MKYDETCNTKELMLCLRIRLTNYTNIGDTNKSINKTITTRSLSDEAYFQINIDLLTCDWNFDSTDTDVIFNDHNEKCTAVMNSKYPIKEVKCKADNVPWYDIEIRELALEPDRAYRYYINYSNGSNSMLLWNDYKIKRNLVVNLLKQKKKEYYESMIDNNKYDPKEMWKCLKIFLKNCDDSLNYKNINFGTNKNKIFVVTEYEAACMFNSYFIKSVEDIIFSVNQTSDWCDSKLPVIECRIEEFQPITIMELKQITFSLKTCKMLRTF